MNSTPLSARRDAIHARIDEVFGPDSGYGSFNVTLTRRGKHQARNVTISWVVFPFEDEVREALGDLYADDVTLDRRQIWTCGVFHADEMEAWKTHEGSDHLEYPDPWGDPLGMEEKVLPDHVEAELRAAGETFESACRPGNYVRCPTCGGGSRILPDRKTFRFEPCPDCVRLGADRSPFFPGVLDLDIAEHRALYQERFKAARDKARDKAAREEETRTRALASPAATAAPHWKPLPTRAAGILNGIPVAPVAPGCDYLTHADDPVRRVRCRNDARWFETTTGLRVCTSHKSRSAKKES